VRTWFDAISDELVEVDVEGRPCFLLRSDLPALERQEPNAEVRLLPAFDQYVLATARDIDALVHPGHRHEVFRTINGWIAPTVVHGGRVVGTWSQDQGEPVFDVWSRLTRAALAAEAARLARMPAARTDDA
jgi:hypothetical protein